MKSVLMVLVGALMLAGIGCGGAQLPETFHATGSLGFWMYLEDEYYNGVEPQGNLMTLLDVPGIVSITLDVPDAAAAAAAAAFTTAEKTDKAEKKGPSPMVNLQMTWNPDTTGHQKPFWFQVPRLPGKQWYYVAYRWDSEALMWDGFINGVPMRMVGAPTPTWTVPTDPAEFIIDERLEDFDFTEELWTEEDIQGRLAKHEHMDMGPLSGFSDKSPMEDVEPLKGNLLYAPDFSKQSTFADWQIEGPGVYEISGDGWLTLESGKPFEGGAGDNHIVFWMPDEFPADFVAEWDFQVLDKDGLAIVFFAAKGQNGEHILDSSLKTRDAHFGQYINGDIVCYHTSYYASARFTCNMRKNNGFYLVSNGPAGVPSGSQAIHKITLMRKGGRVVLGVDGEVIIDWTDDGVQYGPVHGGGAMGLRQMKPLKARYNNFKVWSLK
jgi:hypothetical protein